MYRNLVFFVNMYRQLNFSHFRMELFVSNREREVLVKVQGYRPENILFMVHEAFEGLIAMSFHGVKYDYQIPCKDCLNVVRLSHNF